MVIATTLSRKPAGKRMRRWIADDVMPQIVRDEQPHWIARQVGAALGYSRDGRKLATKIGGDWKKSFKDGEDYRVLTGKDLSDFKVLVGDTPDSGLSTTARLLLLSEKGLNKVLMLTRQPAGDRMRWLAGEVLPRSRGTVGRPGSLARWVPRSGTPTTAAIWCG